MEEKGQRSISAACLTGHAQGCHGTNGMASTQETTESSGVIVEFIAKVIAGIIFSLCGALVVGRSHDLPTFTGYVVQYTYVFSFHRLS